ncbi:MAG: hypothetical protein V7L01_14360 [Nostoc sp.]|uniref:hypothetical protein n=1 Tax=Nostoc sp. TaxID=1180 RepID=UPI002FF87BE6
MNGREVLTEIKSHPNLKCIPFVIITTSTDEQDILRSYNFSANCYVVKPIVLPVNSGCAIAQRFLADIAFPKQVKYTQIFFSF